MKNEKDFQKTVSAIKTGMTIIIFYSVMWLILGISALYTIIHFIIKHW